MKALGILGFGPYLRESRRWKQSLLDVFIALYNNGSKHLSDPLWIQNDKAVLFDDTGNNCSYVI